MLPLNALPSRISSPVREPLGKHPERHRLACDLETKARRTTGHYTIGTLPVPDDSARNVWNFLPNNMVNRIPTSLEAGAVCLNAPPPVPMNTDSAVIDESLPCAQSDDISWGLVYETSSPNTQRSMTSTVGLDTYIMADVSPNSTFESFPLKPCKQASLEMNNPVETALLRSNKDYLCPSDTESDISSQSEFPISLVLEEIVKDKLEEMRIHGVGFVVYSLLDIGVQSVRSTSVVPMLMRTILLKLTRESAAQAGLFKNAMRVGALEAFRRHWKLDGDWNRICSTSNQHSTHTMVGVNRAGLMGSLFRTNIVSAEDITLCLFTLLEEIHFDRLCAIHAVILHADDRLCKSRNFPALTRFKDRLLLVDPVSNTYIWNLVPRAQTLLQDILVTIEDWMVRQADKREHCRESYLSRKRPPVEAVGPRMR